jgi:uncharacterized protein YjiK
MLSFEPEPANFLKEGMSGIMKRVWPITLQPGSGVGGVFPIKNLIPIAFAFIQVAIFTIAYADRVACSQSGGSNPGGTDAPRNTAAIKAQPGTASGSRLLGYALNQPDEIMELPAMLQEVSGLTELSGSGVACVQDEDGVVFIYDLSTRSITKRIPFGPAADYEGLTRVDNDLFVLRSDGALFKIADFNSNPKVTSEVLNIPTKNNEGLCYDPWQSRLLLGPKSRLEKSSEAAQSHPLFAYDLNKRQFASDPAVTLDLSDMLYAAETGQDAAGSNVAKSGKAKKVRTVAARFLPSSLAIHPSNGDIFVISARANMLAVFDRQGRHKAHMSLNEEIYRQPEGITFLPNGELIITSEASGAKPLLFRIVPKTAKTE